MEIKDEELPRLGTWKLPGLAFATYLAKLYSRLAIARSLQARGILVIFDRYPYHALVPDPAATGARRRAARWLLGRCFPRAGLTLLLDVPGSTMFARKGERSEVELEAERGRLLALEGLVGGVHVVDASRPADEVLRNATTHIWQRYARRWTVQDHRRVPLEAGGR